MNSIVLKQKKYRRRSDKLLVILTALSILFLNGVHCVEVGDGKQQVRGEDDGESTIMFSILIHSNKKNDSFLI